MLLAAVSVLVVVASGDPGDGSTRAIEQALRTALVRDATIVVRTAERDTSDESVASMGRTEHATLLGVVSWSDRQRRVTIRFVKLPDGRWTDREVKFDAGDVPTERGRTVGFTLASMMPDEAFADREAAPSPAPAPPPPPPPPAPSGGAAPAPPAADRPPAPLPRPNPLALDATAVVVSVPNGYGGGVGGQFAFRLPLTGALGARAALAARGEAIGPAQATSRLISAGVGLAWQPWLVPAHHRWAAGVRVDGLLLYLDVAHLSEDDLQAAHLSRVLPGLDAALEGTFRFSDHAALVGALGTEVSFGRTEVYVHERPAASLPPAKVLAEVGLRVSFQ